MIHNNAINSDSKKRRAFVAPLFTAGYGERYAYMSDVPVKRSTKFILALGFTGSLLFSTSVLGAKGQLLDQNDKPVAGAWVVATRSECHGFGHCTTSCVEVKIAQTDERGNYAFKSGLRSLNAYDLSAYRAGYIPKTRDGELIMQQGGADARFSKMDAVSGRIAYLAKTSGEFACFTAPQKQRTALVPVFKAMFREALSMAHLPEHHMVARRICREMYWTQLRPNDSSPSPEVERLQQKRYLQEVEPACNGPINDAQEQEILSAIDKGNVTLIRDAARKGFDFNRLLDGHSPPIVTAALKGSAEIVKELASVGAGPDVIGQNGRTALDHMLVNFRGPAQRRLSVVRALLEAGADPNRPDIWGYPPLIRISSASPADVELFRLLLKHGARIDQAVSCRSYCSDLGRTVLHVVRDPNLARLAIEHGADVNAKENSGATPLMFGQTPELIRILLDNGADPNITNSGGWTPLMYVLQRSEPLALPEHRQKNHQIAEMLVTSGAQLDTMNHHGLDAFYYTKDEKLKERLRELATRR